MWNNRTYNDTSMDLLLGRGVTDPVEFLLAGGSPDYVSGGNDSWLNLGNMLSSAQDWLGSRDWKKTAGWGALAGGAATIPAFLSAMNTKPSFGESDIRKNISSAGVKAYGNINRQVTQGKRRAASQFAGRGLGSSGKIVGDIAGLEGFGMQAKADVDAQLNQMLLSALADLDRRKLASSQMRGQAWGDIGDLLLSVGGLLI